jgi:hypothetical protein
LLSSPSASALRLVFVRNFAALSARGFVFKKDGCNAPRLVARGQLWLQCLLYLKSRKADVCFVPKADIRHRRSFAKGAP